MCGIVGIFRHSGVQEGDLVCVNSMLQKQHHRGPDAQGSHQVQAGILGHNRLSIIDLTADSNQPFLYGDVCIAYNGEVYNYLELKAELKELGHVFTTTGDTEVICAAYLQWGQECVSRFMGMWAFALWDTRSNELFCSRDRFGIKPFYYIVSGGNFYFASELKTLKVLPDFDPTMNEKQVVRGLTLGYAAYKDETYYTQVSQLRGAHNLTWQNGKVSCSRYWDLKKVDVPESEEEAIVGFKQLFEDAVDLHMRADVHVGSCLSGGIDSSAIVGTVAESQPTLDYKTFTIFYEGKGAIDERPFAQLLAHKYKNIQSVYAQPKGVDLANYFEHFMQGVDVPPAGSSYYSQYFVMKLASESGMKVLINGQGSDEYLIGYMHTYYRVLADELRSFKLTNYIKILRQHIREHEIDTKEVLKSIFSSIYLAVKNEDSFTKLEMQRKYDKQKGLSYSQDIIHLENKFESRTDNFLYHLLMTTTLPTLLHFEDRNSMAFGIESRVPFLDHRLVEYAFSLPVEWRLKNGVTKNILREALKEVLPEQIYERKDKKGFVTPGEKSWVEGPLKSYFVKKAENIQLNWRLNVLDFWKTSNEKK